MRYEKKNEWGCLRINTAIRQGTGWRLELDGRGAFLPEPFGIILERSQGLSFF